MQIPGAEKAIQNIMKWSAREDWDAYREDLFSEHFDVACEGFDLTVDEIANLMGPSFNSLFGFVFEDFLAARFGEEGEINVVDDYLKRRGWREKVPAKRYLAALGESFASIFEVIEVDPGHSMTVVDLVLGGEPIVINEKRGSEMAVRWDRLAGRVVEVNRKSYFSGAMLLCPRAVADELLSSIAAGAKKLRTELETAAQETGEPLDVTDEALCAFILPQCTPLITHTWLVNVLDRLLGPGPDVRNRDGDELLVSQVRLPLTGDMAAVAARLEYRPEFVRDAADDSNEADEGDEGDEADDFYWSWLDDTTPPLGSEQEDSLALDTTDEGGRTILGSLTLGEDALVLATNSKERAETGSALLATILQGLVGQPLSSYQTPERFIEEHGDELPPGTELPGDVAAAAVHEAIDAHYRQALDQPIPMLDGKTPRQAVKTPAGREQVLYWLKQLENTEGHRAAQQGQQPYDTEWIWRELELDTPQ